MPAFVQEVRLISFLYCITFASSYLFSGGTNLRCDWGPCAGVFVWITLAAYAAFLKKIVAS